MVRGRRLAPLTALVIGVISLALVAPARADEDADDFVTLPITRVSDVVTDEARHRLYVSDRTQDRIVVAQADGSSLDVIDGVPGVGEMALTPDGATLYAAAPEANAVAEIDTTTLDVRLIPTGDQTCPREVAVVGDDVWYAQDDGCHAQHTWLYVLDPATGARHPAFSQGGSYYMPDINHVPGSEYLLIHPRGVSPSLDLVDPRGPSVLATTRNIANPIHNVVVRGDGSEVLIGSYPGNLQTYRLTDLARTGYRQLDDPFDAVVLAGNDQLLAAGAREGRVGVFDRETLEILNVVRFGPDQVGITTVALVNDTMVTLTVRDEVVTMYFTAQPAVPAPSLTSEVTEPVYVGRQATLSGRLVHDGEPVAGVPITVRDDWNDTIVGTPVTDADGRWSLTHTWHSEGYVLLVVRAPGDDARKPAVTTLTVRVTRIPTVVELAAPASVVPGTTVVVQGRLLADGTALGDRKLHWSAWCIFDYPSEDGEVTTGADGTFEFSYRPPGTCEAVELRADYAGDSTMKPYYRIVRVDVAWRRADLEVTAPSEVFVQDPVQATVRLTVDGEPVAEEAVNAHVTAPDGSAEDFSGKTDSNGILSLPFEAPQLGDYTITAARDATTDTLGASASAVITSKQVATSLTASPGQSTISVGDTIDVTGSLARADGANEGVHVQLIAVDENGARREHVTATDANGEFAFVDQPEAVGTTRYWAHYAGDGRYLPASVGPVSAAVTKVKPALALRTDRLRYAAGQTAAVHLDIEGSTGRAVTLTATRDGQKPRVVFRGEVPTGGLDVALRMLHTERLTVTTPADSTHEAASRQVTRGVWLRLGARAMAADNWRGNVAVFDSDAAPRFSARTFPARPGACLRFQAQTRSSGSWRTIRTSACRWVDSAGMATWRFRGTRRDAVPYRMRALFRGDALNLGSVSAWTPFRFR